MPVRDYEWMVSPVRRLRAKGWKLADIASTHDLTMREVQEILGTLVLPPRTRSGVTGIAKAARGKHARGWPVEHLARFYGRPEAVIRGILGTEHYRSPGPRRSRALPRAEKERRLEARRLAREERGRLKQQARIRKQSDPWHAYGWRIRLEASERLEIAIAPPPPAPELLDQVVAEIPAAELPPPAPVEPWTGSRDWRRHGPRKITPDVLAEALELRAAGWSWPRIARKLGCHRQTLYFARKRADG